MNRPPVIRDVRPASAPSHPLMTAGIRRGRSSSPMRMMRPLSSSTPAAVVKEIRQIPSMIQQPDLEGDSIYYGGACATLLWDADANDPIGSLEDFHKPEYAVKLEALMKVRKELQEQDLERIRVKHIASRNEILPPHLIQSVNQDMEETLSSLEKFSANPACQNLKGAVAVKASIPCPIDKRKEMVQVFENMENINKCEFTREEIDEGNLEEYIQGLISKTGTKVTAVEKSIAELKKNGKRNTELLNHLDRVR